jgi:hypothetical protein
MIPLIARLAFVLIAFHSIGIGVADAKIVKVETPLGQLRIAQQGPATVLTLRTRQENLVMTVPAEEMISAGTLEEARLVGVAGKHLLVLTTYASQTGKGGPQAQCAAGQESVLRIVRVEADIRQTAALRVASCWDGIDAGALLWDPDRRTLKLDSDDDGSPLYTITQDGQFLKIDYPGQKQH